MAHATDAGLEKALKKLKLSPEARVFFRDQDGYLERTKRWQFWKSPDVATIIEVATPEDVAETVRFANTHNIPFFAFSSGHGAISSLGGLKDAIQIHMRKLKSITISKDGTYATIGGGAKGKEVRDALWEVGKWTTHGVCECVGLTAIALGGGHGLLEGRYGLMSDQIISLDLVLANGSSVTVSESSHADLLWAMQGAGHNFGIVTSLNYRIYDVPETEIGGKIWSHEVLVWEATAENTKSVYGVAKKMVDSGEQPDELAEYAVVGNDPAGSGMVVITHHVLWNGPLSSIRQFTQPYHDLHIPLLSSSSAEGNFLDAPKWFEVDENAVPCRLADLMPGAGLLRFPTDIQTYNLDAFARLITKFTTLVTESEDFKNSFLLIEQYPTRAVRAADRRKSAVPWRDHVLLISPALLYPSLDMSTSPPTPNAHLDELGWNKGEELRQVMIDGATETGGHYAYVNYALGDESAEEVYGKENLERLRKLKKTYDPENKFGFYAPIGFRDEHKRKGEGERDEL
ncbi:Nn.00g116220.m01.CDS01 [Neocucurbitaria sp. VM-36]